MPPKTKNSDLGELQKVYRVKFGCGQIALYSFIFFPLVLFTIGMLATREFIVLIFVIPLAAIFFGLLRLYFQNRNDELKIYQNGFTYENRDKGLQTCLWKEIESIGTGRWKSAIYSVRKKNGERIEFNNAMQGLDALTADGRDTLTQ